MVGHRLLYLFEKLTIKRLIVSFFLTVLAFSFIYYGLSKIQNGIILTFASTKSPTFFDCIYFSVITISSLGYGDMRPIGVSRVFASLQVLIGLAYLGLIIARLSSAHNRGRSCRTCIANAIPARTSPISHPGRVGT